MKKNFKKIICVVALLGGMATVQAQSIIIYNSLAGPVGGSDSAQSSVLFDSFSTGANPQNQLTDVQFAMNYLGIIGTGNIVLSLYSDNATTPGSLLGVIGSMSESLLTTSSSVFGISLSVPPSANAFTLAPNTRYWIGITATSRSSQWDYTPNFSGVGVGSEYFSLNGAVYPNIAGPYMMQVTIQPVPEPSTLALSAMGGLGMLMMLRRKK